MTRLSMKQASTLGIIQDSRKQKRAKKKEHKTSAQWDAQIIPGGVWIQFPKIPPSLNEWSRWHWAKRDRYLKGLISDLQRLVQVFRLPQFESATVQVVYYFRDARRRDKDNYSGKFLLDALRYAGVLLDDNANAVGLPEPNFQVDPEMPRTEIFIWEVKP